LAVRPHLLLGLARMRAFTLHMGIAAGNCQQAWRGVVDSSTAIV
jgi:hypothetical protein